jgi:hypothetical protein
MTEWNGDRASRASPQNAGADVLAAVQMEIHLLNERLEQLKLQVAQAARENPALLGRPWVMQVAGIVAQEYGVTLEELCLGSGRRAFQIRPRQVWVWLVLTAGGYSLAETARMTCYGDHTSVMHSRNRVNGLRARDSYFRLVTDQLLAIAETCRAEAHAAARRKAEAQRAAAQDATERLA